MIAKWTQIHFYNFTFKYFKTFLLFSELHISRPITLIDRYTYYSGCKTSSLWHFFRLFPEAKARILGPSDIHVKAGSSVTLTCVINQGPHDLGTVFWYRGPEIIHAAQPHPNEADPDARVTIQVKKLLCNARLSCSVSFLLEGLKNKVHKSY